MNCLLLIGVVLLSSASGALLVTLLHLTRTEPFSNAPRPKAHVNSVESSE
jgi:hypothetical protein